MYKNEFSNLFIENFSFFFFFVKFVSVELLFPYLIKTILVDLGIMCTFEP